MFLVDSNVLLDLITRDPVWLEWSREALNRAAEQGLLVVNELVFAEISPPFNSFADVRAALAPPVYALRATPFEAAFVAGQAFRLYRKRGGARTSILSDFLIGAHALVRGYRLITRDARIYRGYFPRLEIVAPD